MTNDTNLKMNSEAEIWRNLMVLVHKSTEQGRDQRIDELLQLLLADHPTKRYQFPTGIVGTGDWPNGQYSIRYDSGDEAKRAAARLTALHVRYEIEEIPNWLRISHQEVKQWLPLLGDDDRARGEAKLALMTRRTSKSIPESAASLINRDTTGRSSGL